MLWIKLGSFKSYAVKIWKLRESHSKLEPQWGRIPRETKKNMDGSTVIDFQNPFWSFE